MIDSCIRWPEAIPIRETSAETIARAFYGRWISRFGANLEITTHQGRQFESQLFTKLTTMSCLAYSTCVQQFIIRGHVLDTQLAETKVVLQQLHDIFRNLQPALFHHTGNPNKRMFVPKMLTTCTHVSFRHDTIRIEESETSVTIDRLKAAYTLPTEDSHPPHSTTDTPGYALEVALNSDACYQMVLKSMKFIFPKTINWANGRHPKAGLRDKLGTSWDSAQDTSPSALKTHHVKGVTPKTTESPPPCSGARVKVGAGPDPERLLVGASPKVQRLKEPQRDFKETTLKTQASSSRMDGSASATPQPKKSGSKLDSQPPSQCRNEELRAKNKKNVTFCNKKAEEIRSQNKELRERLRIIKERKTTSVTNNRVEIISTALPPNDISADIAVRHKISPTVSPRKEKEHEGEATRANMSPEYQERTSSEQSLSQVDGPNLHAPIASQHREKKELPNSNRNNSSNYTLHEIYAKVNDVEEKMKTLALLEKCCHSNAELWAGQPLGEGSAYHAHWYSFPGYVWKYSPLGSRPVTLREGGNSRPLDDNPPGEGK
ncbi:hypothetical protein AAG570_006120 [Ranatra chinensis]|uniref:Integrase catalytic domain-containing protein n=1 Tax=Ranatra chinensis TaxID=642074 RepID=A0ABD0XYV4_9HEMI